MNENKFDWIVEEIRKERNRQDDKWGKYREHNHLYWLGILMEEVGEVAQAIIENKPVDEITGEIIQVVAVGFCWIEMSYLNQ